MLRGLVRTPEVGVPEWSRHSIGQTASSDVRVLHDALVVVVHESAAQGAREQQASDNGQQQAAKQQAFMSTCHGGKGGCACGGCMHARIAPRLALHWHTVPTSAMHARPVLVCRPPVKVIWSQGGCRGGGRAPSSRQPSIVRLKYLAHSTSLVVWLCSTSEKWQVFHTTGAMHSKASSKAAVLVLAGSLEHQALTLPTHTLKLRPTYTYTVLYEQSCKVRVVSRVVQMQLCSNTRRKRVNKVLL